MDRLQEKQSKTYLSMRRHIPLCSSNSQNRENYHQISGVLLAIKIRHQSGSEVRGLLMQSVNG